MKSTITIPPHQHTNQHTHLTLNEPPTTHPAERTERVNERNNLTCSPHARTLREWQEIHDDDDEEVVVVRDSLRVTADVVCALPRLRAVDEWYLNERWRDGRYLRRRSSGLRTHAARCTYLLRAVRDGTRTLRSLPWLFPRDHAAMKWTAVMVLA